MWITSSPDSPRHAGPVIRDARERVVTWLGHTVARRSTDPPAAEAQALPRLPKAHALRSAALLIPSMLEIAVFAPWPAVRPVRREPGARLLRGRPRRDLQRAIRSEPEHRPRGGLRLRPVRAGRRWRRARLEVQHRRRSLPLTTAPESRRGGSVACDVASCAQGEPARPRPRLAESDYGTASSTSTEHETIEPWIHDEGPAVSRLRAHPDARRSTSPISQRATLRANLRVRGDLAERAVPRYPDASSGSRASSRRSSSDSYVTTEPEPHFDDRLMFGDVLPGHRRGLRARHPIQPELSCSDLSPSCARTTKEPRAVTVRPAASRSRRASRVAIGVRSRAAGALARINVVVLSLRLTALPLRIASATERARAPRARCHRRRGRARRGSRRDRRAR